MKLELVNHKDVMPFPPRGNQTILIAKIGFMKRV